MQLTFRNLYNLEQNFDGMVLEISIGGGPFQDIIAAGGSFVAGGYDGVLSSNADNPLPGRMAWTGLSGGTTANPTYITTVANLPAAASRQNVSLQWRIGSDSSGLAPGQAGVRIDTISVNPGTQASALTVLSNADSGGTCPGPTCTLRQAIATAAQGDTIDFDPSLSSPITLTSGELVIDKSLTIKGPGAKVMAVSGNDASRVINISQTGIAAISGLTIRNGLHAPAPGGGFAQGGGIYSNANLTLIDCVVRNNKAKGADTGPSGSVNAFGGGINSAAMNLIRCTISNNTAQGGGGTFGAAAFGGGVAAFGSTYVNCTFSGNTAAGGVGTSSTGYGTGGAIYYNATITNCTIAGNSATGVGQFVQGGGIAFDGSTLQSTIVAQNTAIQGPDIMGAVDSTSSYNLIGDGSNMTGISNGTNNNQIGTGGSPIDPMLGPLQDNGAVTQTRALLPGSPAIDKGNSFGWGTDQRGFTRPIDIPSIPNAPGGDGSDIGAFEFQLKILSINHLANGDILLNCIGVANSANTVQFSSDLVSGFVFLTSVVADANGLFQFEDTSPGTRKFYRITFP